jgi:hypothetical protein
MTQQLTTREIENFIHSERARAKLKKNAIVFPSPIEVPEEFRDEDGDFLMPTDITNLHPKDLGLLMSTLNGLLTWYGSVLATARIDRLTAERVKNFIEAKILSAVNYKEYKAIEDRLAQRDIDETVIKAQDWFDAQEALVIMMEQLYKDYERSYALTSREISRRSYFNDMEGWHDNADNRRQSR